MLNSFVYLGLIGYVLTETLIYWAHGKISCFTIGIKRAIRHCDNNGPERCKGLPLLAKGHTSPKYSIYQNHFSHIKIPALVLCK